MFDNLCPKIYFVDTRRAQAELYGAVVTDVVIDSPDLESLFIKYAHLLDEEIVVGTCQINATQKIKFFLSKKYEFNAPILTVKSINGTLYSKGHLMILLASIHSILIS